LPVMIRNTQDVGVQFAAFQDALTRCDIHSFTYR